MFQTVDIAPTWTLKSPPQRIKSLPGGRFRPHSRPPVYMLVVTEESQENTELLRRHEAHGRFWLLRKGNNDETYTPKLPTNNYSLWVFKV